MPWANDELFASRDNLIEAHAPEFHPKTFGTRGQVYDGWERAAADIGEPGFDEAIVRLGVPGVVVAVDIDTSHFIGNYPPEASLEGCTVAGYPNLDDVQAADWSRSSTACRCRQQPQPFLVLGHADFYDDDAIAGELVTHVRLRIYPDGGRAAARARHAGARSALVDAGPFDLAALEHGGLVLDSSNAFYSSATNLILPGPPARWARLGDEPATRRRPRLGALRPRDHPPRATHRGRRVALRRQRPRQLHDRGRLGEGDWITVLDHTPIQPNIRHRFPVPDAGPLTELRLNVYPDGGLARFRAFGHPTPEARAAIGRRFAAALPTALSDLL